MERFRKYIGKYAGLNWLCLVVYFVLHEYNANYGLIGYGIVFALMFRYLILFLVVLVVAQLFFRNIRKASLLTFIVALLFLFFGSLHDSLKQAIPGSALTAYRFVFPALAIIILGCFVALKYSTRPLHILLPCSAAFSMILLIWQTGLFLVNTISGKQFTNNLAMPRRETLVGDTALTGRPDIFYLVFDSYPGSISLSRDFGFDNSKLDSLLNSYHFYTVHHSVSNYPLTPFSIGSVFNMNYLKPQLPATDASAKLMLQGVETVYQSELPQFLTKAGYEIKNYSVFDLRDQRAYSRAIFQSVSERVIDEQTMWGRIKRDLLWNITLRDFGDAKIKVTPALLRQRGAHVSNYIMSNVYGVLSTAQHRDNKPQFYYCHVELPHPPYYFAGDGQFLPDSLMFDNKNVKGKFIQQVEYSNVLIQSLLEAIMSRPGRPLVIVLQGDHGFRDFTERADRPKIFQNLNSIYFSDGDYRQLYDSMSSVNTFRVVLNKYFGNRLALLPDTSVYIRDPSFDFEKN